MIRRFVSSRASRRAGVLLVAVMATACRSREAGPTFAATPTAILPPPSSGPADEAEPPLAGEEGEGAHEPTSGIAPPAGAAGSALLAEVDRELAQVRASSYSHRTHVDEASGTFEYDCSGFLVYALSRAVPDALGALQATTPRRPRSSEIVAFLRAIPPGGRNGRWQRVERAADLLPGDVVAWLKPAESRSTNTGHTMIVHGAPAPDPCLDGVPVSAGSPAGVPVSAGSPAGVPVSAGSPAGVPCRGPEHPSAFIVPIVDSTGLPHRPGDARGDAGTTGLGRGEIILLTDPSGAPVGYRWSRGRRSREKLTTIALGRLR